MNSIMAHILDASSVTELDLDNDEELYEREDGFGLPHASPSVASAVEAIYDTDERDSSSGPYMSLDDIISAMISPEEYSQVSWTIEPISLVC